MNSFILVDNPLVKRDITILRNKRTESAQFREALKRIAFSLAIEISKSFTVKKMEVHTPLELTDGYYIDKQVVLVPILRAGLSLVDSFIEMIPEAKVGHIGLRRDEKTFQPIDYYYKAPNNLGAYTVIILDPMLATGGSASVAAEFLKGKGAKEIIMDLWMANAETTEGIEKMNLYHPDIPIFTAAVDRELNHNGYILPGLGDAGDRTFGTI